jgi:hypothetical protein
VVEPNKNRVRFVTIDMDNARKEIDETSTPKLYNSYIDVELRRYINGVLTQVDKNGNPSSEPIARISPKKE